MTTGTPPDERRTPWAVARYWMRRALLLEVLSYLSIFRWVTRRPRVPQGAQAFTHHQPVLPLLIVFIVVSAIELVVVDVLVRRWEGVRVAMLVLGIWGLVWMVGLLAGLLTRPHSVGPDGVRLRTGAELDVPLGWEQVASVSRRKRTTQDKQPQVSVDEHGTRTLHLHVQHEANVHVTLRSPVTVRLPRGAQTVSAIELWADRPDDFVAAARCHREDLVHPRPRDRQPST